MSFCGHKVMASDADKLCVMSERPSGKTLPFAPVREQSKLVYLIVRQGAVRRFEALRRKTRHLQVVVMWDRRQGERRQGTGVEGPNRRASDRRQEPLATWDVADFTAVTVRRPR
jgi:hypothetical protein